MAYGICNDGGLSFIVTSAAPWYSPTGRRNIECKKEIRGRYKKIKGR